MSNLTSNQQAFINTMTEGDDFAGRGFELLLKRDDFDRFFDALMEAGLLSQSPAPIPANEEGFFSIPYWHALDYLVLCAKKAGEKNEIQLAEKVMSVVRRVTEIDAAQKNDNYHTNRKFAEIIGLVPLEVISKSDIGMIQHWIAGRFDRSLAVIEIQRGILQKLLNSDVPERLDMAAKIVSFCTELRVPENDDDIKSKKEITVVDSYWLKKFVNGLAPTLGKKIGHQSTHLFADRLAAVFESYGTSYPSYMLRAAIEEHSQNHPWQHGPNIFVEGLRDIMLSWLDAEPAEAKEFVKVLIKSNHQILRRVAIHLLDVKWDALQDVFIANLDTSLFQTAHTHELYLLLKSHFSVMTPDLREDILKIIREFPLRDDLDDPSRSLLFKQQKWLSALAGLGFADIDAWHSDLVNQMGHRPEHPEFLSYMQSFWGPGPSPYPAPDLIGFAREGTLIENLNSFKEDRDNWRGPTERSLSDELESAISAEPKLFIELMPRFLDARAPYQFAIINGFKKVWENLASDQEKADWKYWPALFTFFEQLIEVGSLQQVVSNSDGMTPTSEWLSPAIADFIKAGVRSDKKAFDALYLPRTWSILIRLLELAGPDSGVCPADPMSRAINSPKGVVIEAFINQALRMCRVSDKIKSDHLAVWSDLRTVFDKELAACKNSNFDFSTLTASYISNFRFLSEEWVEKNLIRIFPLEYEMNLKCALEGWAYAPADRKIYQLLNGSGVISAALSMKWEGKNAREKLIERLALAYLWQDEDLSGPNMISLMSSTSAGDIGHMASFFWSIFDDTMEPIHRERVLAFWNACLEINWDDRSSVLSKMSMLASYISVLGPREQTLLKAVVPFAHVGHRADDFIEQLLRLTPDNPRGVAEILGDFLEVYTPAYDYEDKLKKLLLMLAEKGEGAAITYVEKLQRHLPGMIELYKQLESG